jgi:nitrogenase-stabilizing/protective protein
MNDPVTAADFVDDLEELVSAEDFLDYFAIPYEASVVQVNRLHILQRFHDYLAKNAGDPELPSYAAHRQWLATAYGDFVNSDALTEKVFKVFHMHEPSTVFVPLSEVFH